MAVGLLCALRAGSIGWAQGMAILLGQCLERGANGEGGGVHCKTWQKLGKTMGKHRGSDGEMMGKHRGSDGEMMGKHRRSDGETP